MLRRCFRLCGVPFIGNANAHAQTVDFHEWQRAKRNPGIPRRQRDEMTNIVLFHESKAVQIYSRAHCNNFNSNQYLVLSRLQTGSEPKQAILIDMGDDWPDDWHIFLQNANCELRYVFFTHLHIDNLLGLHPFCHMRKQNNLPTCFAYNPCDAGWMEKWQTVCHRYRREDLVNVQMPLPRYNQIGGQGKGDLLLDCLSQRFESFFQLGELPCQYIHTPGHAQGHMMLYLPTERVLFSGDNLFRNSIGRVDLPFACGDQLAHSLRMLEAFPEDVTVLPGHGKPTTLGHERIHNVQLRRVYELMNAGFQLPKVGLNKTGYF
ncbi:metallo-beta-lactamase-like protein [Perkinsela sp. CCAP 1560/4]|nr:metallo-beta-lactamase-like protein [Perkinsela sp. CCAP 1560/4]|eukprot:KNH08053.1 metallo-beta-lactamase-like protein [Perkinsela sp. CCAP 1560/4]